MASDVDSAPLDRVLDPLAGCFTPEVARRIAALEADPDLQDRIDELAEKCNEGTLTDSERREYADYVDAFHLVGILQAKARRSITAPDEPER